MNILAPVPRIAKGQDLVYYRSLERHLKHFGQARADGFALAFTEWGTLAQDFAGWRRHMTERPLGVGKPHARPPRCDTRVSPANRRRFMAQRAAEVAQRRALFDAAIATPTP